MKFQDLKYHVELYGCNLDHIEDNKYLATNCINAHICEIEDLSSYSAITLSHYFFELGVPAPDFLSSNLQKYRSFRENIIKILVE